MKFLIIIPLILASFVTQAKDNCDNGCNAFQEYKELQRTFDGAGKTSASDLVGEWRTIKSALVSIYHDDNTRNYGAYLDISSFEKFPMKIKLVKSFGSNSDSVLLKGEVIKTSDGKYFSFDYKAMSLINGEYITHYRSELWHGGSMTREFMCRSVNSRRIVCRSYNDYTESKLIQFREYIVY